MAIYKVTIQYDGTSFLGFQIQNKTPLPTVQKELQRVFSKIFDTEIKIQGAGRTDTGVHALNQVVHFNAKKIIDIKVLHRALDGLLDKAISVKKVEFAPMGFHARYSALSRKYIYILDNSTHPRSFLRNYTYWYPRNLNIDNMKKAASYFKGHHDFRLFTKGANEMENTTRTIDDVKIFSGNSISIHHQLLEELDVFSFKESMIFFYFKGQSFLHSQVRLMVGNLLQVGLNKMEPEDIYKILRLDRTVKPKGHNLPGKGLYLVGVEYPSLNYNQFGQGGLQNGEINKKYNF